MSAAPTRAEGGLPALAALDGEVEAARLRYEESDRRFRQTGQRLAAMFLDIGAKSCAIVGCVWLALLASWAPRPEYVEAIAKSAGMLAAAACLWRFADRLCLHPWRDKPEPAAAAPREAGT